MRTQARLSRRANGLEAYMRFPNREGGLRLDHTTTVAQQQSHLEDEVCLESEVHPAFNFRFMNSLPPVKALS